ncbi:MAG: hypothetical protein ABH800_01595 [Candidatus Nealsonbacteria bacterium]
MAELTALSIFIVSFCGLGIILFRKMPVLVKLPDTPESFFKPLILKVSEGVIKISGVKNFSHNLLLQKVLSRFCVLTLKTENKTNNWLERLRHKKKPEDNFKDDHYWEELKKAKKND